MLVVVVSDTKSFRKEHTSSFVSDVSDVVVLNDISMSIVELEQYLYPSLFSSTPPVIHIQFMLEQSFADLDVLFAKKLAASPTVFLFEEFVLPASTITTLKKYGAVVHTQPASKSTKKGNDMFALASSIITPNKKDSWMNFQHALTLQPVEALLGIMYWKVRDMMLKNPRTKEEYKNLYASLLQAHAKAWQTGTPLELMIEKVLLS
ncbi:hypothetical protein K2Q02_01640 [Patescibacteria group bacterium]|nr:hypothetical protein [Patescibacteria group bacterium]